MRVLILADTSVYHPYKWKSILQDLGNEVKILTLERPLKGEGVFEIRSNGSKLKYLLSFNKVKRFVEEFKPDVIFPHFLPNYGLLAYRLRGFKILALWGSDIMFWPYKSPIHRILAKKLLNSYNLIVCDAQKVKEILINDFGVDGDIVRVIPFGVHKDIREKPLRDLERDVIRIVSIRRLEPMFNHDEILRFVELLSKRFKVEVFYLGEGSLKMEILKKCKDLSIEFLGRLKYEEYVKVLSSSHFCISIPTRDATSVSLLEAVSLGCVPIISNIPVYFEWFDEENSIISEPKAEKIYEKFTSKFNWQWWENTRKENKRRIEALCNWEKNVENLWKEVLSFFNV